MYNILVAIIVFLTEIFPPSPTATSMATKPVITIAPTATLTPTPTEILSPTITPSVTPNTIDCTGPDGKHLQVTQQQCDAFNKAWRSYPYVSTVPNQSSSNSSSSDNRNNKFQSCMDSVPTPDPKIDQEIQQLEEDGKVQISILENPNASGEDQAKAGAALSTDNFVSGNLTDSATTLSLWRDYCQGIANASMK